MWCSEVTDSGNILVHRGIGKLTNSMAIFLTAVKSRVCAMRRKRAKILPQI
ncbi:MAG: hypothetical protein OFPII_21850 [Osedax symbiont Rs1]|nr:MAG: hypothetical protein OFPII_21850 [Osedax symbiont Rs1]